MSLRFPITLLVTNLRSKNKTSTWIVVLSINQAFNQALQYIKGTCGPEEEDISNPSRPEALPKSFNLEFQTDYIQLAEKPPLDPPVEL
jgi:hypothetical protein